MKYYVYAGYYENYISGHELDKPYVLRDEFNSFEDAIYYVESNWGDDWIGFTRDIEDEVYDYFASVDESELEDHFIESYVPRQSGKFTEKFIEATLGLKYNPETCSMERLS